MKFRSHRKLGKLLFVLPLVGVVAACGYSTGDRALSGGAIGAGAGAAGAAVTGGSPAGGAILGGAAGAVIGAVTHPHDVNLGRPIWR